MNDKAASQKSGITFRQITGVVLIILILIGVVVTHGIRQRLPAGLMQDIRAGVAARNLPDADQRFKKYLELRYGPLSDRANERKAFLDFFNVEHIKSLQFLVKHTPDNLRQANIEATAKWLTQYRQSLTPPEQADLAAQIYSPEGQTMLRAATAQYNSQDVRYRGETVPVISQLLTTIAKLPKP